MPGNADQTSTPRSAPRITQAAKEKSLRQRGRAIWLYGYSGAGKSTLAVALEGRLAAKGFATALLDGDEIRSGLNRGLGFSEADRAENLRRSAEVAKLFVEAGIVVICAFITPLRANRSMVRDIIGPDAFLGVYLSIDYATCARRDPKGLYRKAAARQITQFTGLDSSFETPAAGEAQLVIDTGSSPEDQCLAQLCDFALPRLKIDA
ncbi:MAG TPA: adenylyl-sulfate kinase [Opitutaceae bacterium]|nr:adenylyl-sulfate kinase [Opitutaceae bacterium]